MDRARRGHRTGPFQLVGNAVDGNGAPNANDAWNVLSFMISEPGSTVDDDVNDRDLRTISVGDYESLFVAEEDPGPSKCGTSETRGILL